MTPRRGWWPGGWRLLDAAPWPRKLAAAVLVTVAAFVLWPPSVPGEQACVSAVTDGDSLRLLSASGQSLQVRLAFVDAPELAQPGGAAAHAALQASLAGRCVQFARVDSDRYQRVVARLWLDGEDVGLALLRQGWAWHYRHYARSRQADADFTAYAAAEQDARAARRGLWRDARAQMPWRWRARQRATGQCTVSCG